ncbi:TPA: hypothetical protein ACJK7E_000574 [Acinetobacter baumannii]
MTDLNKESEVNLRFEQDDGAVWVFDGDSHQGTEISHLMMMHSDEYNEDELRVICHHAACEIDKLRAELEKAKAQAVPDGYVLIKKEDIENWYLDESEYMWFEADGIDGYLEDIDIGEVVEVQRKEYVVTNSNPVFAAKPWDDKRYCADTWEFFESKDEAEKAAAHCKAMFEASESGAEQ